MDLKGCALCDEYEGNLTLVEHEGFRYQLCDEHLHLLLKLSDNNNCFSPASCTYE